MAAELTAAARCADAWGMPADRPVAEAVRAMTVAAASEAERFLAATARKAGLPPTAWRAPDTQVLAFSADVFGEGEGQA